MDDLYGEIKTTIALSGRVLVATLTKKMAEDLTTYFQEMNLKARYLHSDIDSLERVEILRDLRKGVYDVLIGINLLREGLDLPEVQLVAVMDADKEGFLRSRTSLIQVTGRAARNAAGRVIFYADHITESMRQCIEETDRRRAKQIAYNVEHGITPKTIEKRVSASLRELYGIVDEPSTSSQKAAQELIDKHAVHNVRDLDRLIRRRVKLMQKAAGKLDFEKAAELRNEVNALKELYMSFADYKGERHEESGES